MKAPMRSQETEEASREWQEQWLKLSKCSPVRSMPKDWSPPQETEQAWQLERRQPRRLKRRMLSLPINSPILSKSDGKWRICPLKAVIDHEYVPIVVAERIGSHCEPVSNCACCAWGCPQLQ